MNTMQMKNVLTSLVFLVSCLIVSASYDAVEKAIQPRTKNAQWEYVSYYFEDGEKLIFGSTTEKVLKVGELDGVTIYRIEQIFDWRTFWQRVFLTPLTRDDRHCFWEYFSEKGSFNFNEHMDNPSAPQALSDFTLTLPYPVEKGHRYQIEGTIYEVIEIEEKITVPAGTFSTVVYELEDEMQEDPSLADRQRYFITPGVGLVRWEMDVRDESGNWKLDSRDDLIVYHLEAPELEKRH